MRALKLTLRHAEAIRAATAVSICFVLVAALVAFPSSASKRHCPTASVQFVAETLSDGSTVLRAPGEGDPEFKACTCSVRKASEAASQREDSRAFVTFVLMLPEGERLPEMPVRPVADGVLGANVGLPRAAARPPLTPPPIFG